MCVLLLLFINKCNNWTLIFEIVNHSRGRILYGLYIFSPFPSNCRQWIKWLRNKKKTWLFIEEIHKKYMQISWIINERDNFGIFLIEIDRFCFVCGFFLCVDNFMQILIGKAYKKSVRFGGRSNCWHSRRCQIAGRRFWTLWHSGEFNCGPLGERNVSIDGGVQ